MHKTEFTTIIIAIAVWWLRFREAFRHSHWTIFLFSLHYFLFHQFVGLCTFFVFITSTNNFSLVSCVLLHFCSHIPILYIRILHSILLDSTHLHFFCLNFSHTNSIQLFFRHRIGFIWNITFFLFFFTSNVQFFSNYFSVAFRCVRMEQYKIDTHEHRWMKNEMFL